MGNKPVDRKHLKHLKAPLFCCDEEYLLPRGRKLNQPGNMGEFLRSGRQDVYNTHETEILSAKISRLGLEEDLKFSLFTKCIKLGLFCIYPITEKQKTQSLFLIKSSKGEIWEFNKGDSRNHPVAAWMGLEVSSIPQKPLGQQNPSALSIKGRHEHSAAATGTTCRKLPYLPDTFVLILHPHSVFPFWLLLHIGLVN